MQLISSVSSSGKSVSDLWSEVQAKLAHDNNHPESAYYFPHFKSQHSSPHHNDDQGQDDDDDQENEEEEDEQFRIGSTRRRRRSSLGNGGNNSSSSSSSSSSNNTIDLPHRPPPSHRKSVLHPPRLDPAMVGIYKKVAAKAFQIKKRKPELSANAMRMAKLQMVHDFKWSRWCYTNPDPNPKPVCLCLYRTVSITTFSCYTCLFVLVSLFLLFFLFLFLLDDGGGDITGSCGRTLPPRWPALPLLCWWCT